MILYNHKKHAKAIAAINDRNDAADRCKTTRPATLRPLARDEKTKTNETQYLHNEAERLADFIYRKQERRLLPLDRDELVKIIYDSTK
jgi:hypothetical protein